MTAKITPEQVAEARRLRSENDARVEDVAVTLKLTMGQVYRALTGVPRRNKKRESKLSWTAEELDTLRRLYPDPDATWDQIMAALPGRRFLSIQRKAAVLDVKRRRRPATPNDKTTAMVLQLRAIRMERDISVTKLSKLTKICRGRLTHMELGTCQPSVGEVIVWAAALGYRLRLEPASKEEKFFQASVPALKSKSILLPANEPNPKRSFSMIGPSIISSLKQNRPWRRSDD